MWNNWKQADEPVAISWLIESSTPKAVVVWKGYSMWKGWLRRAGRGNWVQGQVVTAAVRGKLSALTLYKTFAVCGFLVLVFLSRCVRILRLELINIYGTHIMQRVKVELSWANNFTSPSYLTPFQNYPPSLWCSTHTGCCCCSYQCS